MLVFLLLAYVRHLRDHLDSYGVLRVHQGFELLAATLHLSHGRDQGSHVRNMAKG